MAMLDHYHYPSAEAEFTLYNFHSQQQVDTLVDVLVSQSAKSARVLQLVGDAGSGRHYLLRAAAHHAGNRGVRVAVEELSLDGYEPDAPLKALLEHLSRGVAGSASDRLSELARHAKVEIKVTPANLLLASLGVKADLPVQEIPDFLQPPGQTRGAGISNRERLRLFLERVTQSRRLVLYIGMAPPPMSGCVCGWSTRPR
jgi:hypothetical protein